jgi:hypothetical protein
MYVIERLLLEGLQFVEFIVAHGDLNVLSRTGTF